MKGSVQLVAFVILLFAACNPIPSIVHITGSVLNTELEKVRLMNDFEDMELDLTDGTFATQFELKEPTYFNLRIGRESTTLFLSPGQSIDIQVDAKEFDESVKYSGDGSEASNYLAARFLNEEKAGMKREDLYKLDEDAFYAQLSETERNGLIFLEDHNKGLSKTFIILEKVNIAFDQKNHLLNYEPAHAFYAKIKDFKASDNLTKSINEVDFNKAENLGSTSYSGFITSYLSNKSYQLFTSEKKYSKLGKNGILKASLDLISSKITNEKIQGYATDQIIKQTLSYSSALGIEPLLEEIKSLTDNPKTFDRINKSLDEWGHLAKGMPAPDFDGMTLEGEAIKLSDLKGKNVYIDVWATWCGPCIGEQPALFKLEEKYKNNKNLAFMGVSIDSDKEAWSKMVSKKDMKGEQIFTDGAWKSTICTGYLIKGIPRFILISKEGKIIDSDAPRPSSDQIKDILKELSGEPLLSFL